MVTIQCAQTQFLAIVKYPTGTQDEFKCQALGAKLRMQEPPSGQTHIHSMSLTTG